MKASIWSITAICYLLGRVCIAADPFCAVTLDVSDFAGNPVLTSTATLFDENGRPVEVQPVIDGVARFCDFDFGPHAISVGDDSCSVLLKPIRLIYGMEQKLKVTRNLCLSIYGVPPIPTTCNTFLRVADEEGHPVDKATVSVPGAPFGVETDKYGRIAVPTKWQSTDTFLVSKPSFVTSSFLCRCFAPADQVQERKVVLRRER